MSYKNDSPCHGCEDRAPGTGCHSKCERYKAWKQELDNKNRYLREERDKRITMSEQNKRAMWRNTRYAKQARNRKTKGE